MIVVVRYLRPVCLLVAVCAVALAVGGCGPGIPNPYEVSGTVTFGGKPIPKGFITFLPDTTKGNKGPGGGAPIVDGEYRTAAGKGVAGGPYTVKIVGYTGISITAFGEELVDGPHLFLPYVISVDLPKEDTKQDFTVPKPGG